MRLAQPLADFAPLLSVEAMFGSMDVFHANHLMVPAPRRTATLMSVYDLTPIRFPEFHLASNRFTARQLRRWTDRADRVIVNSQVDIARPPGSRPESTRPGSGLFRSGCELLS